MTKGLTDYPQYIAELSEVIDYLENDVLADIDYLVNENNQGLKNNSKYRELINEIASATDKEIIDVKHELSLSLRDNLFKDLKDYLKNVIADYKQTIEELKVLNSMQNKGIYRPDDLVSKELYDDVYDDKFDYYRGEHDEDLWYQYERELPDRAYNEGFAKGKQMARKVLEGLIA